MFKELTLEFSFTVTMITLFVFLVIKLLFSLTTPTNMSIIDTFARSLFFYSKSTIRNARNLKAEKFYKLSNLINQVFYILMIFVLANWYFMSLI